ncbi:transposase [uncultured Amaricoccus sp.]|uniref:transposase n=1 Tax=uncultured Amaricoccus sp. TaxID=339341 RepID=UPI0026018E25|nr:transposase [uncultured Amaricoccus sp.]
MRAPGFAASLRVVSEWATRRRRDDRLGQPAGSPLSARTIARGLTIEREAGPARIALVNAAIETAVPELIVARDLMDRFHAMMRCNDAARLDPWIAVAKKSTLASFAAGVEADKAAIAAAITEPWSSGQVEGKVNRLKLIKRQMYGRANPDLLKARVTAAAHGSCTEIESAPGVAPIDRRMSPVRSRSIATGLSTASAMLRALPPSSRTTTIPSWRSRMPRLAPRWAAARW